LIIFPFYFNLIIVIIFFVLQMRIFILNFKVIRKIFKYLWTPNFVQAVLDNSIAIPVCRCDKTEFFLYCNNIIPIAAVPNDRFSTWSSDKTFSIDAESYLIYHSLMFVHDFFYFLSLKVYNPEGAVILICLYENFWILWKCKINPTWILYYIEMSNFLCFILFCFNYVNVWSPCTKH